MTNGFGLSTPNEYVRRQMALRDTELEKLLERYIGSGIAKRGSECEEPGTSASWELGLLDLALGATPFAADERHNLIERWSRVDATVGWELAARDVTFEDLAHLTELSIKKVLPEVEPAVSARALTDAPLRMVAAVTRKLSHVTFYKRARHIRCTERS